MQPTSLHHTLQRGRRVVLRWATSAVAVSVLGLLGVFVAEADLVLPGDTQTFLRKYVSFTDEEIQRVEQEKVVVKMLETPLKREVAVFGILWINANRELYIASTRTHTCGARFRTERWAAGPTRHGTAARRIERPLIKESPRQSTGALALYLVQDPEKAGRLARCRAKAAAALRDNLYTVAPCVRSAELRSNPLPTASSGTRAQGLQVYERNRAAGNLRQVAVPLLNSA